MANLANRLRERITLQLYDEAAEAWGSLDEQPFVWAQVEAMGGERYRFTIRYRPDFARWRDVDPAPRLIWNGAPYDITDVVESVRRTEVQLLAEVRRIESEHLISGARMKTAFPQ